MNETGNSVGSILPPSEIETLKEEMTSAIMHLTNRTGRLTEKIEPVLAERESCPNKNLVNTGPVRQEPSTPLSHFLREMINQVDSTSERVQEALDKIRL
jgi:hypothetical protein